MTNRPPIDDFKLYPSASATSLNILWLCKYALHLERVIHDMKDCTPPFPETNDLPALGNYEGEPEIIRPEIPNANGGPY